MQNKIILQLNATANWGSTGKIAEGIGIAAINRGWQSYIAYGRAWEQKSYPKFNQSNQRIISKYYSSP